MADMFHEMIQQVSEQTARRSCGRRSSMSWSLPAALLLVWGAPAVGFAQLRVSTEQHTDIIRRAQVWIAPALPVSAVDFEHNPPGPDSFDTDAVVDCRFKPAGVGGSTPKFDCELPDGDDVKVKYGRDNPEVFAEVMASRLMAALGFPADRMYVVDRVRCFGCPPDPFPALQCLNDGTPRERCFPRLDYTRAVEFEDAVIERPVKGRRIETRRNPGWRWDDLARIDAAMGGASRAQVDALRLMGVFLAHWDNKSKNQRLVCLGTPKGQDDDDARPEATATIECERPLAMVHDLGDAFGPFKLDVNGWRAFPVWADASACRLSMRSLPYGGSTFPDVVVSEEGRAFLAERLSQFSADQIRALLRGARLMRYQPKEAGPVNLEAWVQAFQEKIHAIVDRRPCPTS